MTSTQQNQAPNTSEPGMGALRQLMPYLLPYWRQIALASLALIVAAGTVLAIGSVLKAVIDQGLIAGNADMLNQTLLTLMGVIIVLAIATFARFSFVSWIGERVVADLRTAVYGHILRLSPAYFETARTGDILARLTTDTTLLQHVVGSSISMALRNTLLLIGGLVMLAVTSFKLTGMVLLVVPLVIVPIIIFGRKVRALSRISQDRISDINAYADETLHGIKTIQAYTYEDVARENFGKHVLAAVTAAIKRIRARALLTMIVITLVFSAISLILWVGGHDVLNGQISAGQLSAFVFYAVLVAGAVGALSEVIGDVQRAAGAVERIFDLLVTTPHIKAPENPADLPRPATGHVSFSNVTFAYPSRPDHPTIRGLSLDVKPGEKLAIVGPSGGGKTTLFQLLLRFYDPQQGSISFDDIDLRMTSPAQIRLRIGLVAQDPVIFSANAWDNIAYGMPGASKEKILEAARAAHALEFLEQLPQGLDSFLGEKGVRLSGGQRQRIAIARAILRDPPLLLLDEATSALDAESERYVQEALAKLMEGRTTMIIAHRLATVMNADRIAVIDQGKLVATGTHHELIGQNGLYARLATLQFEQHEKQRPQVLASAV
ncbi:MAG: ATP-binding cassette domain-containing protein [Alphaproteobacteria bacterium]|nr:ATP-binding cassette domain-containing protein [Alphaproteobacteria bacterium]